MSLHADLLEQAKFLATKERGTPNQANLRRAISASYYALFHRLVGETTRMLISRNHSDALALKKCVSRAFRHSHMRDVCKSISQKRLPSKLVPAFPDFKIDDRLVKVGGAFVRLQEARHQADYDTYYHFERNEALRFQKLAANAIDDWNLICKTSQADVFMVSLLIRDIQS